MQKLAQSTSVFAKFLHSFISTFTFSPLFEAGLIRPNIRTWRCRRPSNISRAFIFICAMINLSYAPVEWLICKSLGRIWSTTIVTPWRSIISGSTRWRPLTSKLAISIVRGTSSAASTYLLIWITDAGWRSIISKLARWRSIICRLSR